MNRLALGLGLVTLGFVGGALAKGAAPKEIVQKTVADLEWKEVAPGVPVMASEVWKGPGGSHCAWNKFPKGFVAPTHFHTTCGMDVQRDCHLTPCSIARSTALSCQNSSAGPSTPLCTTCIARSNSIPTRSSRPNTT